MVIELCIERGDVIEPLTFYSSESAQQSARQRERERERRKAETGRRKTKGMAISWVEVIQVFLLVLVLLPLPPPPPPPPAPAPAHVSVSLTRLCFRIRVESSERWQKVAPLHKRHHSGCSSGLIRFSCRRAFVICWSP